MDFEKLADYFNKIEGTASRLDMISIVSELFSEAKADEIKNIIYLCQSELGPKFKGIDTGLGEKFIVESIAKSTGFTRKEIEDLYKEKGDLGLVAEFLMKKKKQSSLFKEKLSIQKVFNNFLKIASMQGAGSQESKIKLVSELINSSNAVEAKYIVRIPLGNLRLGTGDPTLMDALADLLIEEAKKNKKLVEQAESEIKAKTKTDEEFEEELYKKIRLKVRELIEEKYNIHSDLGEIAELIKKNGFKGLDGIKITPGIPIRPTLAERLDSAEEIIKKLGRCLVEGKYDGFRLQVSKDKDNIIIFSRQSENVTEMFPEIVEAVKKQIKAKSAVIEGEALAFNEKTNTFQPFQITITRKRKYGIKKASEEMPLRLYVFDVMFLDGKNLMNESFKERRKILSSILRKGETINLTQAIETDDSKKLNEFFDKAIEEGLEGIIAKDLNAKYIAGARKFAWIKLKRSYKGELQDSVDLVILGYFKGKGKRTQFGLGVLLAGTYDEISDSFKTVAKVGTGMTEQRMKDLEEILSKIKLKKKSPRVESEIEPDVWVEPKYVIEVRADEITKSPVHTTGKENGMGYALRFPRLISMREKTPEEATTESEIISMYKKQKQIKLE